MESRSWLLPNGIDRERMLDMDRRLAPLRRRSFAILGGALLACGPWFGFWTLAPLAFAALLPRIVGPWTERSAQPEYALFVAWAMSELIIAASVALTGGASVPTLSWLALPVVTLCSRFSTRGVLVGVGFALTLMVAVALGVSPHEVVSYPPLLIGPAALLMTIAIFSGALMRSDLEHRQEAVIDPLTGMLNRVALERRTPELAEQSAFTGEPVGVLLGDVDHFKAVNDTYGHATGDAVLRDLAHALRTHLRAFDLAYRLGGEEFLILLPGADLAQSTEVAESLRTAIDDTTVGDGKHVTISFGVSASLRGEGFEYDAVFAQADAALYAAKRAGRNLVRADSGRALHAA
jgi:diguanylate cyclase (GGDEF)-like protein